MESYATVARREEVEFVEKRSRFIGNIAPVKTAEEATGFLASVKARNRDASHNCHAYILKGGAQRYSDDGEPQGTAGLPMLEVLRREGIVDVIAVVTRYFGGVLLGAPGLVRAYSHTAKLALDAAKRVVMRRQALFAAEVPYPLYDRVNSLLQSHGVTVTASGFTDIVSLELIMPEDGFPAFESALMEATNAAVTIQKTGEAFA